MEKLKYAAWTPQVKEKQKSYILAQILTSTSVQSKKSWQPCPTSAAYSTALQHTLPVTAVSGSKLGTESSEHSAKKFQTALSVSEESNGKYIQKSVSPLMLGDHTAAALCKLLWAALPVKQTKVSISMLATGDYCIKCS